MDERRHPAPARLEGGPCTRRTDPVAIVGQACRLPGAEDTTAFWDLLTSKRSAIRPMEGSRWPASRFVHTGARRPGRSYTDSAALIADIWSFDPGAFSLSRREAAQMDPQQRLLLMVAVEALEDAGYPSHRLSGRRVGVYVGCSASDHGQAFFDRPEAVDAGFMTGNTLSVVANRISHCLNLDGPSVVHDTACSSSLYALDHAVRSLSSGEVDVALVGAVHALLSPLPFIGFSQAAMLSPTGRLRPFDAAADGYVRGEGAVAFVLTRADSVRSERDRVHAEIVATGTGASGRTPSIARPDGSHQSALMAHVLRAAGREPDALAFVEAHGTGTAAGDPTEAAAIANAFAALRRHPLPVGSVKGNIGHLEPAAGAAGLLKAVLALQNAQLPPTAGLETPNPAIPLDALGLSLPAETLPLERRGADIAAVNSFGFGGANACAILRRADPQEGLPAASEPQALVVTASSEAALAQTMERWRTRLADATVDERARLAAAAGHRLEWQSHRAVLSPDGRMVETGSAAASGGGLVFAFSGNGAQYAGMGAALHASCAAYREAHDRVAELFAAFDPMQDPRRHLAGDLEDLQSLREAQPALFALQVGLVEALADRGLRPDGAIGHSLGEVAAAWCAGALGLEDAVRLIATRAPLVEPLAGSGGMAAVRADPDRVLALIGEAADPSLCLSAINSPTNCSVSGSEPGLAALAQVARAQRVALRRLGVPYPYHSAALDPLKPSFDTGIGNLAPRRPRIALASSTLGDVVESERLDMAFWWRNLRAPVQFDAAVTRLARSETGVGTVLEVGPRPVLTRYLSECLETVAPSARVLASLDAPDKPDAPDGIDRIAARLVANGAYPDLTRYVGARIGFSGSLPRRIWSLERFETPALIPDAAIWRRPDHPLLGTRVSGALATWESRLDTELLPWLAHHVVDGRPVVPASALCGIALAAARLGCGVDVELLRVSLSAPLIPQRDGQRVRTRVEPEAGAVTVESCGPGGTDWTGHLRATLRPDPGTPLANEAMSSEGLPGIDPGELYEALSRDGLVYGPRFKLVEELRMSGARAWAMLASTEEHRPDNGLCPLHLDAACHGFHPLIRRAVPDHDLDGDLLIPVAVGRLRHLGRGLRPATAELHLLKASPRGATGNVVMRDAAGRAVTCLEGLRFERVPSKQVRSRPTVWFERQLPLSVETAEGDRPDPGAIAATAVQAAGQDAVFARLADASLLADALCRCRQPAQPEVPRDSVFQPDEATLAQAMIQRFPDLAPCLRFLFELPELARNPGPDDTGAWDAISPRSRMLAALAAHVPDSTFLELSPVADAPTGREATGTMTLSYPAAGWNEAQVTTLFAQVPPGAPVLVVDAVPSLSDRLVGMAAGTMADMTRDGRTHQMRAVLLAQGCTDLSVHEVAGSPSGLAIVAARTPNCKLLPSAERRAIPRPHPSGVEIGCGTDTARIRQLRQAIGAELDARPDGADASVLLLDTAAEATDNFSVDRLTSAIAAFRKSAISGDTRPLWIVSCSHESDRPIDAGLTAAIRVAANELRERRIRLIALSPQTSPKRAARVLSDAISGDGREPELYVSTDCVAGSRIEAEEAPLSLAAGAEKDAVRLEISRRGDLSSLAWQPTSRRAPEPDEVEIEVAAAGLNYRDALWARGVLPSEALEDGHCGASLGMECAGRVVRTGCDAGLTVGTRVLAVGPHALATHMTLRADRAVRLPDTVDLTAGAALPVAALTASYALEELARPARGEWVLVHGAAGGVGLACLSLALSLGAKVIATAGTTGKRRLLQALGAHAVFDSRSLMFADEVRALTGGAGVDIVINSISGDAMRASIECLAPFGRFIELGKRDILENRRIGLQALGENISFHAVDLDRLLRHRPACAERLMRTLEGRLAARSLPVLPVETVPPFRAESALRRLSHGSHIGKLAVEPPSLAGPVQLSDRRALSGTWLVTGGTSGLGLATAARLAQDGASTVWLVGRRPHLDAAALKRMSEMRAAGTEVVHRALDVSSEDRVRALMAEISATGPLEGIVHAATAYDDAPLARAQLEPAPPVMRVKLEGAHWLDKHSRPLKPRYFVLFASLSAWLGSPGQALYAAANAGLEALARKRQAEGLPALAIAWGAVGDCGHLARDPQARTRLEAMLGAAAMPVAAALDRLSGLLRRPATGAVVSVAAFDPRRVAATAPETVGRRLFGSSVDGMADVRSTGHGCAEDVADTLRTLPREEAHRRLVTIIREELAAVLRQKAEDIAPDRPLALTGLDSLMIMDLALSLERRLGPIAAATPTAEMTPTGLAAEILAYLARSEANQSISPPAEPQLAERLAQRHLTPASPIPAPTRTAIEPAE